MGSFIENYLVRQWLHSIDSRLSLLRCREAFWTLYSTFTNTDVGQKIAIQLMNSLDQEATIKIEQSQSLLEEAFEANEADIEHLKCNEKIQNNPEEEVFCTCKH